MSICTRGLVGRKIIVETFLKSKDDDLLNLRCSRRDKEEEKRK